MMFLRCIVAVLALTLVSGCASKFRSYNGPEVTRMLVYKSERKMFLLHNDQVLAEYEFELGFAPAGDKVVEGDGRTPEGEYIIDRRNPNSNYHLSIGINYPNERDIAEAEELGVDPGGDIFFHGTPKKIARSGMDDWTWGCIAVTNREMEDIYAMVQDGTRVSIYP